MSTPPDLPPLPDLFVAELDDAELARLLSDVLRQTTLHGVTLKQGPTRMVEGELDASLDPVSLLRDLLARLPSGPAATPTSPTPRPAPLPHGFQLRYEHGGIVFYDTLLRRAEGWRLTRIAPPHAQGAQR